MGSLARTLHGWGGFLCYPCIAIPNVHETEKIFRELITIALNAVYGTIFIKHPRETVFNQLTIQEH